MNFVVILETFVFALIALGINLISQLKQDNQIHRLQDKVKNLEMKLSAGRWSPNITVTASEKTKCNTDPCTTIAFGDHANPGWDTTYTMEVKDRQYPYLLKGVFKYTEHQDDASVRKCNHAVPLTGGGSGTTMYLNGEAYNPTWTPLEVGSAAKVINDGCSNITPTYIRITPEGKISSVPGTNTTTETITNSESHAPVQVVEQECSWNSLPQRGGLVGLVTY